MRALVGTFNDPVADRVMPAYDGFATAALNCAFPAWFYTAWAISGLVPLVKRELSPEQEERGDGEGADELEGHGGGFWVCRAWGETGTS